MTRALPEFVEPMLAVTGSAFDSDDHLFEIKWDGMRALAFVDRGGLRMVNRKRNEVLTRFPELAFVGELRPGLALDGELVVTRGGKPDFRSVMQRAHARNPMRIASLARGMPATYVVFDLLYEDFDPLLDLPLVERRARLEKVVASCPHDKLVLSDGVVGQGRAMFEHAAAQGLEGVVAKQMQSPYQPGKRSGAWIKIKRRETVHCAIIGFEPDGQDDFKSLVVATDVDGVLTPVGQVGSGIDRATRAQLNALLWSRLRGTPIVPCTARARWVEPGLYCTVSYLERSAHGNLRAPVFVELIRE